MTVWKVVRRRTEFDVVGENGGNIVSGLLTSGPAELLVQEHNRAEELAAMVAFLELQVEEARFRPMGDNHHNALACPHCNPKRIDPEAAERALTELQERLHAVYLHVASNGTTQIKTSDLLDLIGREHR